MFRNAYAIASHYTWPVVLSRKTVAGKCSASIGASVIVNDQGWLLTAAHIIDQFLKLADGEAKARAAEAEIARIEADTSLDAKARKQQIRRVARPAQNDTDRCSAWWGRDECKIVHAAYNDTADLAVGRIEPFDPNWVATYPIFKDPTKDFEPGVSLCKLGYPFYQITPQWDATANSFRFPLGTAPLPRFPLEGILTRIVNIAVQNAPSPPPYPMRMIETSSPGLRGQSGGPIFDQQGTIRGIQSRTIHWPGKIEEMHEVARHYWAASYWFDIDGRPGLRCAETLVECGLRGGNLITRVESVAEAANVAAIGPTHFANVFQ